MTRLFILSVFFIGVVCASGCSSSFNLATNREESLMFGTEKEEAIGQSVSKQIEKQFKVVDDIDINERAQKILSRIAEVSDRKDLVFVVRILAEDEINAVSLPGGYIYIFKGLMDNVKNDDQLAGVIAHEVGHITAKHAIKRMQASYGYLLLQIASVQSGNGALVQGVSALAAMAFSSYSQQDEFEADRLAVKYTAAAGYDPSAMADVLRLIKEKTAKGPLRPISYLRTHPYIPERIAMINKQIQGQMSFQDYLNLTGNRM